MSRSAVSAYFLRRLVASGNYQRVIKMVEISVAEAILLKQGLLELHERLWGSLSDSTGKNQIN